MADQHFIDLSDDGWNLAYDDLQWIIRKNKDNRYYCATKAGLERMIKQPRRDKETQDWVPLIELTDHARQAIARLPATRETWRP